VRQGRRGTVDWHFIQELLLKDSERLIRALLAEHEERKDPLAAIGYVFEFGRGQLCFELCANTRRNAQESLAEHMAKWPDKSADEFRWNSGDYDYPGAADQHGGGWSELWWTEVNRLDRLAEDREQSEGIQEAFASICSNVLAELARRGVLGDWTALDFNVSGLLDKEEQVKRRDERIRKLIGTSA
jgi:hypothetical protein